jgi:hypothetical protein
VAVAVQMFLKAVQMLQSQRTNWFLGTSFLPVRI